MFSEEERNRIRDRLIDIGRSDSRVVAAALVGSSASGADRWSDIDLTFGMADGANVIDVLTDWTKRVKLEFGAIHLFDLPFQSTIYRVFLMPGNLQVDLSFTPGHEFGAFGPRFVLLYGKAVDRKPSTNSTVSNSDNFFGLSVHHLVRARVCIERNKFWQAEYWISSARDQILAMACCAHGLETSYGRGFDGLSKEILEPFTKTLITSLDRDNLLKAVKHTVEALLSNTSDVSIVTPTLAHQLRELGLESK
jgi:hypothetical protein